MIHHRISNHLKRNDAENCIFHEPVISCDTIERLITCLTSIDVTELY